MIRDSIRLASAKTGGISLLSIFYLLAGLVCLGMQIVLLTGGRWQEMEGIAPFVTGIAGLILLGLFAWTGLRRGEVVVFTDRVEGISKAGRQYSFPLEELGEIEMSSKMLVLKGKDGKTLLAESPPHDRRLRGLIWLLLHHELPGEVWHYFPEATEDGMRHAIRKFLGEDTGDDLPDYAFMDQGLLIELGNRCIYLPVHDTVAAPAVPTAKNSLSTSFQATRMVIKFEPNPGDLPLANLAAALLAAPLEEELRLSWFEALAETHGGVFLEAAEEGQWEGETAGWKVQVIATPIG